MDLCSSVNDHIIIYDTKKSRKVLLCEWSIRLGFWLDGWVHLLIRPLQPCCAGASGWPPARCPSSPVVMVPTVQTLGSLGSDSSSPSPWAERKCPSINGQRIHSDESTLIIYVSNSLVRLKWRYTLQKLKKYIKYSNLKPKPEQLVKTIYYMSFTRMHFSSSMALSCCFSSQGGGCRGKKPRVCDFLLFTLLEYDLKVTIFEKNTFHVF